MTLYEHIPHPRIEQRHAAGPVKVADQMVYQVEKLLKDSGDKLPEGDKKEAEEALVEAKAALASLEKDRIKTALETLTAKSHKLAESLYKHIYLENEVLFKRALKQV